MESKSKENKVGKKRGRGRPRIIPVELTIENKQSILDYIKQGMTPQEIAKEMSMSVTQVKKIYNRYSKEMEEVVELDRVDRIISSVIEKTVSPRESRVKKMHQLLNSTVDAIYENCMGDDGKLSPLDAGDFAMILKLLERDEQTIMASGRLQTTKKKNNDNRYFFNKEKMIKVDELNRQYNDTTENDVLVVENVIQEIEDI